MGDVHHRDKFGMYPIMHAVHGGHTRLVKYLVLELKVDVMVLSQNGNTCVHYAFEKLKLAKNSASKQLKWENLIRFLVENGAEEALVTPNKFGQFPEDFKLVAAAKAARTTFVDEEIEDAKAKEQTARPLSAKLLRSASKSRQADTANTRQPDTVTVPRINPPKVVKKVGSVLSSLAFNLHVHTDFLRWHRHD